MYTSVSDAQKHMARVSLNYFLIAIFCVFFNQIYTLYSYGESSVFMERMFLFPLLGGALPAFLFLITNASRHVTRLSYNLWNSGIALLVAGCIVRGVINISGRATEYDEIYWGAGTLFLVLAFFSHWIAFFRRKRGQSASGQEKPHKIQKRF